mgnify:FL=1
MPYAYYNDIDAGVAAWLRNLIRDGLLPEGDVDERSIKEVHGADLKGYTQVHFFAGIGGWAHALERAGWDPARPVWTGSCPCQPFSVAGRLGDTDDPRHLWPEFFRLIAECRPSTVFGEQVASKLGRGWLAGVRADLETLAYAVGAVDLSSASAGAPHIRQRLWWVAHSADADRRAGVSRAEAGTGADAERRWRLASRSPDVGMADAQRAELQRRGEHRDVGGQAPAESSQGDQRQRPGHSPGDRGPARWREESAECCWSDYDLIPCRDNKVRRVESGTFPLAHGLPTSLGRGSTREERVRLVAARANRKTRLGGYGNAINPTIASIFVTAYLETEEEEA